MAARVMIAEISAAIEEKTRIKEQLVETVGKLTKESVSIIAFLMFKRGTCSRHNPYQLENSIDRSRNLPLVKDDCTSLFLSLTYALEMQVNAH